MGVMSTEVLVIYVNINNDFINVSWLVINLFTILLTWIMLVFELATY
jgi:hypothetical protein